MFGLNKDIWRSIGLYVDYTDLNNLRLTCKDFLYIFNLKENSETNDRQIFIDFYKRFHTIETEDGVKFFEFSEQYIDTTEGRIKKYLKNGLVHRINGPALIQYGITKSGIKTDTVYMEKYYINGKLHRINGPAVVYPKNSNRNKYYQNGFLHRLDGPAMIDSKRHYWYKNGKLHREKDKPAIYTTTSIMDGRNDTSFREWYIDGQLHRTTDAAHICPDCVAWYKDGKLHRIGGWAYKDRTEEKWCIDGKLHRYTGPAHIKTYNNHRTVNTWYKNNIVHRDDGPAIIDSGNSTYKEYYYQNGVISRGDGPAIIRIDYPYDEPQARYNMKYEYVYLKDGYYYREDDLPTTVEKHINIGEVSIVRHWVKGHPDDREYINRGDLPSLESIVYNENITIEHFWIEGQGYENDDIDRGNLPVYIKYVNGVIVKSRIFGQKPESE